MKTNKALTVVRALRAHAFISVAVVGVLLGGGLRFVPTSTAAAAGSGAAATACAAQAP